MRAVPFDFHAPRTIDETLSLVGEHGEDGKLLAGGMSLVPMLTLGLARPTVMISLNHVGDWSYVKEAGDTLLIGAMTRHDEVMQDPLIRQHCPALSAAASHVGDVQVRHRGTIGGSVAHADPAADYLPVLYGLNATVRIRSARGEREVPVRDFIVDSLQTVLEPDEALVEIIVPKSSPGTGWGYERLARVEGNFAIINAAAFVDGGEAVVAIGAAQAAPVIVTVPAADEAFAASEVEQAAFEACADAYSDLAGGSEYRQAMASVYARRAVRSAFDSRTA